MPTDAICVRDVTKHFGRGRARTRVLDRVSLAVAPGEMVALLGPSGSGKSTLLRHIAGLVASDAGAGEILVHGACAQRAGRPAADIRAVRAGIGFVFQQFNLVARLDVLTNVLIGLVAPLPWWRTLPRLFTADQRRAAMRALARVGMDGHALQRAETLSGGQQQRVAIARALVQRARIVLADEPVASLDPRSARAVLDALAAINREDGVTVVVSLHQVDYATRTCHRIVGLRDGRVVHDSPASAVDAAAIRRIYGDHLDEAEVEPVAASAREASSALVPAIV